MSPPGSTGDAAAGGEPATASEAGGTAGATQARGFADHLLEHDDPFNALTWYRWSLYLDPDQPTAEGVRFKMALAYERGDRWDAAEVAYGRVGGGYAARAAYRAGMVNLAAARYAAADRGLESVELFHPHSRWADRARFGRGVVWLRAHDLQQAALRFDEVGETEGPWGDRAEDLARRAREPVPRRSPALASGLSALLPGAGQVYSGHVGDGIMAFIANGVLGVWSYTLIRHGVQEDRGWEVGLGSTIGVMFLLTYSSNVYGAGRSAKRFGTHAERRRAEELLDLAYDPRLELSADTVSPP